MNKKGYKVFNSDWTCRGFQYEVGKTYEQDLIPDVCNRGFHFCKKAADCFNYYSFDPLNKVAEIIAYGEVAEDGDKCATNKIEIVREIPWAELLDIVNTGKGNSGLRNSGDCNSGECNSGNHNSGDCNSGNHNSGDCNSGNHNSGDCNSGNLNSGDCNSGNHNSGDCNSGNHNSGNHNSGNHNQGDFCTGDFNISNHETGCFCTEEHKIRFFDKESEMTFKEWRNSKAYQILCRIQFEPTTWVCASDMTDAEKVANPDYKVTGGYLKVNNNDKAFLIWWESLTDKEKQIITGIPNFDAEKFKKITGIKVDGKSERSNQ